MRDITVIIIIQANTGINLLFHFQTNIIYWGVNNTSHYFNPIKQGGPQLAKIKNHITVN